MEPNPTHDAARTSWLDSANTPGTDFPIQNLPFAVFRRAGSAEAFRGGVAIGDQVIDLAALSSSAALRGLAAQAATACAQPALNDFFAMGPAAWRALRHGLFALLERSASGPGAQALRASLIPQAGVEYGLPTRIGDYTDFYTSYHHALNIGRLFGIEDVALNFHHIPIAYHGRASSVVTSGTNVRRPLGQSKAPAADGPSFGPCRWLDYELELGVYVGTGNALGEHVPLRDAERHLFGLCLLNDWSARDIQGWEMHPLGPFQAKNFATTVSPWIVTMEALAPYRLAWQRAGDAPQPLPYLDDPATREQGAIDIRLDVGIESASRRAAGLGPARLTHTSFRHQHWTVAQMLAHHTVGGCNLQAGDLFGTGTISGPTAEEAGAMMELTHAGRQPIRFEAAAGRTEERGFLADGDAVVFTGWCEKPGFARIGFGECRGMVTAARELTT
jgi:fumarylacetoacetase